MSDIREDAKNVKKEFVKSKFVEAAKAIILRDGMLNVTVRLITKMTVPLLPTLASCNYGDIFKKY